MENNSDIGNKFSIIKRAKSFEHAGRGLGLFIKTTHNAWIHIVIFIVAISLGFYFHITHIEWIMLVLTGGLVLAAEAFNTAIEFGIDLTAPQYHPYARDTKDVAAGAVLISALTPIVIGFLIFGPYFIRFLPN